MPDLAILVPSRGRPQNITRLVDACAKTCRLDTVIAFGFDDDDDHLSANLAAADGCFTSVRHRMGLAKWTNALSALHEDATWQASIGDDMVPLTDGWDERLCEAAGTAGMAYPNDRRRDDIPEAIVISTRVVLALGWFCEPSLQHWYVDNVWSDLGRGAGCISYLPGVLVEHRHPNVAGGDKPDPTYWQAAERMSKDLAAYQKWRLTRMRADVETVRSVNAG